VKIVSLDDLAIGGTPTHVEQIQMLIGLPDCSAATGTALCFEHSGTNDVRARLVFAERWVRE
jgi:hypothetical protein